MINYLEKLPDKNIAHVKHGVEFYHLLNGKRTLSNSNIGINEGVRYLINNNKGRFYIREVKGNFSPANIRKYITDGNVFLWYSEEDVDNIVKKLDVLKLSYNEYMRAMYILLIKEKEELKLGSHSPKYKKLLEELNRILELCKTRR